MSYYGRLIAGENIYLEQRGSDTVIHSPTMRVPQKNLHSGFFRLDFEPTEKEHIRVMISNCIFRLNGVNHKLNDYELTEGFEKYIMVYLHLDKYGNHSITCERYDLDEEAYDHIEDRDYILLYRLIVTIGENIKRLAVETFAAGGFIDTIFGSEGFLYMMLDGTVKTTITYSPYGPREHFFEDKDSMYIPCFNPASGEGVNIKIPRDKGGVVEAGKGHDFYIWKTTGYPSEDLAYSKTVSVNISVNSVYFA